MDLMVIDYSSVYFARMTSSMSMAESAALFCRQTRMPVRSVSVDAAAEL